MSQTTVISLECKTYILTSGTRATWGTATAGIHSGAAPGSLAEIDVTRDATLNLGADKADVSSRKSIFGLARKSLRQVSLDIEMPLTPADANYKLLLGSYVAGTSVAVAALDGDKATAGSSGFWADWEVMEMHREEGLKKEVIIKFHLEPTSSAVPPEWVTVGP